MTPVKSNRLKKQVSCGVIWFSLVPTYIVKVVFRYNGMELLQGFLHHESFESFQIGPKEEVLATTILTSNFVGIIWSIFALNSKLINKTRAFNLSFCLHQSLLCSNLLSLLHFSLCFCLLFLSLSRLHSNCLIFIFSFFIYHSLYNFVASTGLEL